MDSATGMGLYYLGQRTKGAISKKQPSWDVLARWMTIGLCDGFSSHEWYLFLEKTLSPFNLPHWQEAATMTALTSVFFTPFYCAAFLSGLTLLEGKGMRAVRERLEKDYVQLTKATVGTWSVFNCFLFSCVEFDNRVTVAMTAHFVYLIVLALWNEGVFSAKAAPAAADTSAEAEENAFPQIAFDLPPPTEEELQDVMLAGPGLALTDEMEPVDFEQLAEDVDDFVQEVGDKVNGVGQHVLEAVEEAGEAVEHFGEKVTAMVEDMVEDMVETEGGPGSVAGEGKTELESAPRRRDDVREKRAAEQDT